MATDRRLSVTCSIYLEDKYRNPTLLTPYEKRKLSKYENLFSATVEEFEQTAPLNLTRKHLIHFAERQDENGVKWIVNINPSNENLILQINTWLILYPPEEHEYEVVPI